MSRLDRMYPQLVSDISEFLDDFGFWFVIARHDYTVQHVSRRKAFLAGNLIKFVDGHADYPPSSNPYKYYDVTSHRKGRMIRCVIVKAEVAFSNFLRTFTFTNLNHR